MKVLKRDGTSVDFESKKILKAIKEAFKATGEKYNKEDLELFIDTLPAILQLNTDGSVNVETIQDIVENWLMSEKYYKTAKAYILYRENHKNIRFITGRIDYIQSYINSNSNAASSSETDDNANVLLKNVANLNGEVFKSINRQIQRRRMKQKLAEMYNNGLSNQYLKDLDSHIIYTHDESSFPVVLPYCSAYSLYPLITEGVGNIDGVTPKAPKNLDSFCGQFVNLVFLLASQVKGAVAFGGLFVAFNWYCVKEWGNNYYKKANCQVFTSLNNTQRTVEEQIIQYFQQIIWGINQPAGNRSSQSPFTNVSYYDKNYYNAMFEDFAYPDTTKPEWEQIDYLQRLFMRTLNKERLTSVIAFPVETMCLLSDGKENILDKEYKEFTAQMYAEGHSFFTYISDSVDSLASCCFSGKQKVLWKSSTLGVKLTTLKELHDLAWEPDKKNLRIFHNGSWISGKPIELSNIRDMYRVITYNNKEFIMTDNHINVTLYGEKSTSQLTTEDYLMFNTLPLNAIPENNEHLTYEMGFVIGAFLGDGSMGSEIRGTIHDINFSQNEQKYAKCIDNINKCAKQLGLSARAALSEEYNSVYPVRISSKELVEFIKKWTNWERGVHAENKDLNLNCLLQSYEFRKGILDGWYNTDGGNSNRCYTTSPKLAESMEVLITSLGMQSIINVSDRTDEKVIIRGVEYNRNFPLYCVRWYTAANHRVNKDNDKSWIKKNNSIFFKIKSIEKVEKEDKVYCIECKNQEEPYFTLPSGLITHNCRLRNEITENVFSFTNGLSGLKTGSCNVITLNLNRIIQDWFRLFYTDENYPNKLLSDEDFRDKVGHCLHFYGCKIVEYLKNILERVYKYHTAYKTMLYELENKGMLSASKAGYIRMQDLYSTIGLNGINEAAMFLGIKVSYNRDYIKFCRLITSTIKEQNKLHSNLKFKFNQEFVPAESLGIKNFDWDKKDGYIVPNDGRVLYNSYFYDAHDNTSVFDKLKLHGKEMTETLDGGVGCHLNLNEHLSKEQYLKIIDYAIKVGCSYFTFNIPNTKCDKCGFITKHNVDTCPKCGSDDLTKYTRVIGYLRPTKSFSKGRQIEEKQRTYTSIEQC